MQSFQILFEVFYVVGMVIDLPFFEKSIEIETP